MKYEFTGVTKIVGKFILRQIIRKIDNTIGGWIEGESNLSQEGDAWVSGNAYVSGNARVFGDARVSGNAYVFGNACVSSILLIINVIKFPYSITITPQNIVIGCEIKSRFGKGQWTSKCNLARENTTLIKEYSTILKVLKKQAKRSR